MRKLSKKTLAVATTVVLLSGGSAAYAYWTTIGEGTGTATAGTTTAFTVTSTATTGSALSPGGPTQKAHFVVNNPGTGAQKMSQVLVSVANADGSPWIAVVGCGAADFKLGTAAAGAAQVVTNAQTLAPLTGQSIALSVDIQMVDTAADQNACKSVTVPLYYAVS